MLGNARLTAGMMPRRSMGDNPIKARLRELRIARSEALANHQYALADSIQATQIELMKEAAL